MYIYIYISFVTERSIACVSHYYANGYVIQTGLHSVFLNHSKAVNSILNNSLHTLIHSLKLTKIIDANFFKKTR